MKKTMLMMIALVGISLAVTCNVFALDKTSSSIQLEQNVSFEYDGNNIWGNVDAISPFQISLLGEHLNTVWNFNHSGGAGYNFADIYDKCALSFDSRGNIPVYNYNSGDTGEDVSWTLNYEDGAQKHTLLAGNISFRVSYLEQLEGDHYGLGLYLMTGGVYRSFPDDTVRSSEVFDGQAMQTDLIGLMIAEYATINSPLMPTGVNPYQEQYGDSGVLKGSIYIKYKNCDWKIIISDRIPTPGQGGADGWPGEFELSPGGESAMTAQSHTNSIPEPATVVSLLFGALGIVAKRRLFRKK